MGGQRRDRLRSAETEVPDGGKRVEKDILDKYAWHIHTTIAAIENAKEQRKLLGPLFDKIREICRERGISFDEWCESGGGFGVSKRQIYRYMQGTTGN